MKLFFATLSASLFLVGCSGAEVIAEPLKDIALRPTPLHFGMHVTPDPKTNPIIPPERFEGYHVGEDFEVSAEELNADVPVFAVCKGKVLYSGFAEGYGGLIVQQCTIKKQTVNVMYGHLTLAGLPKINAALNPGQQIALLAPARSHDSDGNRKHLHLGIHAGKTIDMRGYVQTEAEISQFLDPAKMMPFDVGSTLQKPLKPYWQPEATPQ